MFLKISQNSQKNTLSESLFNAVEGVTHVTLLKNTFFTEYLRETASVDELKSFDTFALFFFSSIRASLCTKFFWKETYLFHFYDNIYNFSLFKEKN